MCSRGGLSALNDRITAVLWYYPSNQRIRA